MQNTFRHRLFVAGTCLATGLAAALVQVPAQAADWLTLQGTEPAGAASRAKLWGFIQPQFQYKGDTKLQAGPWRGQDAAFNQIGPNLDSSNQFQLRRARLGVRGTAFPLDSNINYFLLIEAGNNGVTEFTDNPGVALTDASVTFNHFKEYTRVRMGQFKTPGSEDGLAAIHVHNYVDFATATNQLLLERFFDNDGNDPRGRSTNENKPDGFGAYRDIGIQLFNSFKIKPEAGHEWELSYAGMIGNGNGINRGDDNSSKDVYLYFSGGQIFEGKGPRRQDWKAFAWYQSGERTLKVNGQNGPEEDFDRTRFGIGATYRRGRWRAAAEYYWADGMIFAGTDGGAVPGNFNNAGTRVASFNVLTEQKANGGYLDIGFKVLPKLELDYRFGYLNRATKSPDSQNREFTDHTFGLQYFFNKKARAILNYQFRNASADDNSVADDILSGMDNVASAQVLVIF